MLLLYFLPIISFRFSSKFAMEILVPIAVPRDVIELEGVINKDYFYTLYEIFC